MVYDKPFKTYEEQISKLINDYDLLITDCTLAKRVLTSISYYDLINGYKNIFMENNKFKVGISIEYLYEFHLLDKSIQAFIMKYSHLNSNHYQSYACGTSFKDNVLAEILPLLMDQKKHKLPSKHYIENHNHVPPWILFKNISFGDAINLFNVLERNEKEPILQTIFDSNYEKIEYSQKIDIIRNGLENVRAFRNLAAHNLHFVQYRSEHSIQPKHFKNAIFNNLTEEQNQLRTNLFADYCKLTALPSNILDRLDKYQQTLSN